MITVLSTTPIARYMTPGDPIPLIPPRVVDAPSLIATLNPLTILRYGGYVHSHGAVVVHLDGHRTDEILPPNAQANSTLSLASWLLAIGGEANNQHSLALYNASLTAAIQLTPGPNQQHAPEAPREHSQQENRKDFTRAQRATINAINAAGHAQNATEGVVPNNVLFEPIRIGRIWYVKFAGEIVLTAPIEKRARHIARAGNDFLRSLPKQALVDPSTMLEQFNLFFLASVDPSAGFQPKIRTNLEL
jgi:hypothetical protein